MTWPQDEEAAALLTSRDGRIYIGGAERALAPFLFQGLEMAPPPVETLMVPLRLAFCNSERSWIPDRRVFSAEAPIP